MKTRRLLLLLLVAAAIAAFLAFDLGRYLSLEALKARQEALSAYAALHPGRSAALFFAIYTAATALSIPGAAILTLGAGAVFGFWLGLLIVSFASTIGATLAFLAARFLLRDAVKRRFGERARAIDQGIARDGAFYLFTLRLVPLFPFFLINLLMGLTALPARTFYWVSQVGMLAGTAVYVNAGTQLAQLTSLRGILSPGLLLSFTLLGIFPLLAKKAIAAYKARRVYARWPRPRRVDYNMVVIGAGSAGLVSAYIASAVKARVALVEKHRMGGDCLNTGCVPSKALIKSARLMSQIRHAGDYGLAGADARVDFAAVMARVRRVIADIEPHDSVERYAGLGVEPVIGEARIVSPFEVEVRQADGAMRRLTTRSIVIAAGARPFVPPIPGLDQVGCLTSDTLWELNELPRRLLVLGGGPIGCELAQAFARLGSDVTQVEMAGRLMAREDADVSELVANRFRAEGIRVLTGHKVERFETEGGEKMLVARHAGGELRIGFDVVICALGRVANTAGYGLEELGIPVTAARTVETDDYLQTLYPNILAAGDVAGPYQFTHVAAHQAWYAAVNGLFGRFRRFRADYSVIPWATFIEPEVARVGLNEQEAKEKGIAFEVTRYGIDDLDRAIADGVAHGWVKVLTVPGKDKILGATIVGEHAGDLIAEFVLAMKHGLGMNKLLGTIHIYPTLAEANKYAAGNWKRAHAPERLLGWVQRFHAWQRG
ncbi:FAD-dependent oxidoreductase [Noviherbaspirillum soli]|uniref:FAD-dependent oxidoreductase n=1 Tax=Noviherbaspirillum soli TaxID=1064518 RepID=UPI00188A681A|nr:bifunctional TVP38/TMEM64 family protein/FAD-dependent oxidoreductase [Noviherbaspirillum soli]